MRAGQVRVSETEDEELVGVRDCDFIVVKNLGEEVVVVGDPQGVQCAFALLYIRAESDAFQFGGNLIRGNTVGGQYGDDIQERRTWLRRLAGESGSMVTSTAPLRSILKICLTTATLPSPANWRYYQCLSIRETVLNSVISLTPDPVVSR